MGCRGGDEAEEEEGCRVGFYSCRAGGQRAVGCGEVEGGRAHGSMLPASGRRDSTASGRCPSWGWVDQCRVVWRWGCKAEDGGRLHMPPRESAKARAGLGGAEDEATNKEQCPCRGSSLPNHSALARRAVRRQRGQHRIVHRRLAESSPPAPRSLSARSVRPQQPTPTWSGCESTRA